MLSSKVKLFLNSSKNVRICSASYSTPQTFNAAVENIVPAEKKKRPPFMKNVFLGIGDDIFLQYPDPKNIDPSKNFKKLLNDATNSLAGKDLKTFEKFKVLVECGILKCNMPVSYGGIEMTNSEFLNLCEQFKLDPSLAVLLETQYSFVSQTILNHGSNEIKQKYLSKVMSGELTGAYAMSEESSGSDPSSIKTVAEEEENCFRLNGEKLWVTNAENANFFLIFANNIIDNNDSMIRDLSVFLVEKNKDITLEKHSLFGLNDCGLCKVKLKNVTIPKSNLIGSLGEGYQIAGEGLRHHNHFILVTLLNHLKYFLSSAVSFIHERKQFPVDLKDCELVQNKLMNITSTIYAFESMLYLISGISDNFIIDDSLESALLQLYGLENGLEAISQCIDILGSRAYDSTFPYENLWRNLKGFSLCSRTIDVIKLYVSLTGMDYAGNNLKDIVKKNRNPFDFPSFAFKKLVNNSRQGKDKPKLLLKLYTNLHPRFKNAAEQLEYCILRLQYVVEMLLSRHGSDIVKRQVELMRIAGVAKDIFAMTAVLSRASKSYCTGVQFCDDEAIIANVYCYHRFLKIKSTINGILQPEKKINDILSFKIASHILNNNSYVFQHPLKPNIV